MTKLTDIERARNKRKPRGPFVDLPEDDDPTRWLVQLLYADGRPVPGRTGISFGLEGVPDVSISAVQARELGNMLIQVADHLETAGT